MIKNKCSHPLLKNILIALSCLLPVFVSAQQADRKLEGKIQELIKGFHGDIGVYIQDLRTQRIVSIDADSIFPTASIVKVPIMIGINDKLEKQELNYDQQLIYKDSLLYAGEDILGSFKNDEKIALSKVMMLMLTTSDNTASLWLQSLAGGGTKINNIMEQLGLQYTRVNSRTIGREEYRTTYGWGQTTPREMAKLFELIYNKKVISPTASERMMRLLGRNYWDAHGLSQIPPTIEVFSKNGAVDASRSEVMLVNACHHPYILSIFTKNNVDQSWNDNNEAWTLTKKISQLTWNHFNRKK